MQISVAVLLLALSSDALAFAPLAFMQNLAQNMRRGEISGANKEIVERDLASQMLESAAESPATIIQLPPNMVLPPLIQGPQDIHKREALPTAHKEDHDNKNKDKGKKTKSEPHHAAPTHNTSAHHTTKSHHPSEPHHTSKPHQTEPPKHPHSTLKTKTKTKSKPSSEQDTTTEATSTTESADIEARGTSTKYTVTAKISSIKTPTASIVGKHITGKVCTAAVPQLPTPYADFVVAAHNVHRANHSAPKIVWDNGLASSAASWASYCNFSHNLAFGGGGYGQNIAAGIGIKDVATVISDLWYNNEVNAFKGQYGKANPDFSHFESWGHMSQVVWGNSIKVGCATIDCNKCGVYMNGYNVYSKNFNIPPFMTVCNYKGPGNFGGQYAANIKKPKGLPTVHGRKMP